MIQDEDAAAQDAAVDHAIASNGHIVPQVRVPNGTRRTDRDAVAQHRLGHNCVLIDARMCAQQRAMPYRSGAGRGNAIAIKSRAWQRGILGAVRHAEARRVGVRPAGEHIATHSIVARRICYTKHVTSTVRRSTKHTARYSRKWLA